MNNHTQQTHKKTALIIGCNGAFGNAIGLELLQQGWHVKGMVRNKNNCPHWLTEDDLYLGDCQSIVDLQRATNGIDLIVYAANPAYHQWSQKALSMLEPTVKIAEKNNLHMLFPGNVYAYNPRLTPIIDEQSQTEPMSEKGAIRVAMEKRLLRAAQNGATVTIIRAGDFIVKNAQSSWFNHILSKGKNSWLLRDPSPQGHLHCYSWMPDLAANAVALLAIDKQGFNVWHDAGVLATHQDWLTTMQQLNLPVTAKKFPWWQFKLIALLDPVVKEVLKMRYLWQQPLRLDGSKMQRALGEQYRSSSMTEIMRALTAP